MENNNETINHISEEKLENNSNHSIIQQVDLKNCQNDFEGGD